MGCSNPFLHRIDKINKLAEDNKKTQKIIIYDSKLDITCLALYSRQNHQYGLSCLVGQHHIKDAKNQLIENSEIIEKEVFPEAKIVCYSGKEHNSMYGRSLDCLKYN